MMEERLSEILTELQAVHADMAVLATSYDVMISVAAILLLVGVVVGVAVGLCFKEWFR